MWPELLGTNGQMAVVIIKNENMTVKVFIVKPNSFVTDDFRCDRVRVWVDGNGTVIQVPKLGLYKLRESKLTESIDYEYTTNYDRFLVNMYNTKASRPLHMEIWLKQENTLLTSLPRGPVPPSGASPCTNIPGGRRDGSCP
ncbi:hypothetical protein RND71_020608 [Anisodus tanguticus]|uniref:Uncharacterized protein n=1 Tax=Anisodus tanguticus TaxID=243964 RepID=A0AAE1S345_9SOLA|nr:hypothetical protein RND71_020608 [Anisodus tanguticus]